MHNYDSLRQEHSTRVSQTIDSPVMVFDYFELGEVFAALGTILLFGLIVYSWKLMILSQLLILGVGPVLRRRHPRGIFFHLPYRYCAMSLPGLINPRGKRPYSD